MDVFKVIATDIISMLFPLMLYSFYVMQKQNMNLKEKNIFFDFAIFSSLYLLIQSNKGFNEFIICLNIPLLILYLKNHYIAGIIISVFLVPYYQYLGYESVLIISFKYLFIYLIYLYYLKKDKSNMFFIKSIILIEVFFSYLYFLLCKLGDVNYLFKVTTSLIIFIVLTYVIIYLLKVGEDIISLHLNIKDLEKDKQFRVSLFKITHEIKNPITVCKSYLDMLDFENTSHQRFIPIIKGEINKILLLLQDFLSMNKIKIDKDILDINLLLEDIIYQLDLFLKRNKVSLNCELIDDEIYINGDYNRLSQVFINIIKNALEAEAKNIEIKTKIKDKKIYIKIIDNGYGMDKRLLTKIKEPFFTTKKEGTGLGVSLSVEIIESHEGKIVYHSKEGIGTTVTVILPLFIYS